MASTAAPRYHPSAYPAIDPLRSELSTKGKSVLVTGAGSGIGAEIALAFAKSGTSHLGLVGRKASTLETTKATIEARFPGVVAHVIPGNLTDASSITNALQAFAAKTPSGKIDVLVANAGAVNTIKPLDEVDPDDFWQTFDVNVRGNFNLLRAFGPLAAADAIILNVSSAMAHIPYIPGYAAYQSSKQAAIKIFDHFTIEHGLRVIHFHPGLQRTEIGDTVEEAGLGVPFDELDLPGAFAVWAASPEAAFLDRRLVYAAWDVDDLKAKAQELRNDPNLYTVGLQGFQ
ncbi:hypothetical protein B0H67DRAFT_486905 [Lasiosphaeris hirsuta]|uniref:Uncharacterized protein n=1 Tax=Lasiosphaeris hirsuta TaxID=260670 RepID=A0AA40AQH8_9PEZI|nr:hypothetical protein B0H67DRAFT_486905 [Lasiosphaeris hirsuta]